jgi:lipoprotein signal peptidase
MASTVTAIILFVLDRWVKYFFITNSTQHYGAGGVIWLQYYLNQDMAFSLPLFPIIYYSLMVGVLVFITWRWWQAIQQKNLKEYFLLLLILIGAFSNLYDRWQYGGVIDFIWLWLGSIFNLADVYIVAAMLIWFIWLWRYEKISTHH